MANGLSMSVGLDLTEIQKNLSTLRSSVTGAFSQLEAQMNLVPVINTAKFTSAIQDMKKAYGDAQKMFGNGIKISYTTPEGQQAFSRSFQDAFGSISKMKASAKELRALLSMPSGQVSWNKDQRENAEKLVSLIENYTDRWKTAGSEITKNKEKILDAARAEKKLLDEQNKRISSLKEQLKPTKGLLNSDDLRQQLNILKQMSREYRSWGTDKGKAGLASTEKQIANTKQLLNDKVKQEKQEARILQLLSKQDELLKKQALASAHSIEGIRQRYNIARQILGIQDKVNGTSYYRKDLVAAQNAIANPADALFNRRYSSLDNDFAKAKAADDLQAQLEARKALLRLVKDKEVQSGASLTMNGQKARDVIQSEITAINASIEARKKDDSEKEKAKRVTKELAAEEKKLADIEKQSHTEPLKYSKKIRQLREEERMIDKLIRKWEAYRDKASKAGMVDRVNLANSKLSELSGRKAGVANAYEEQRAMIRSVNQNNSLLNEQASLLGRLRTLASRYFSIFTIFTVGKKIIETTGYFQQQQVALEGILGSAAKAEAAIQRIKSMALTSPKTTQELVGYTKQLSAYNVGGGDPDKLLDIVDQLADLSTGLGVDMQRLILAYGQVNAAAVLRGQELRQFTEAGIPMVEKLAEKFTQLNGELVTTGQVFEYISKRKVPFEMVADVLREMTQEGGRFYQMQENVTNTLYGQVQKLKDLWTLGMNDTGRGLGGVLTGFVKLLQDAVKSIRGILKGAAFVILTKTAAMVYKQVKGITAQLALQKAFLSEQAQLLKTQKKAYERIATLSKMTKATAGAIGLNVILVLLGVVISKITNAINKVNDFKNALSDIDTSFAKDTTKLTSGLDSLLDKLASFSPASKSYKEALDTLKSNYGEYVSDSIISQLESEADAVRRNAGEWSNLADQIKAAITSRKEYERHETRQQTAIDEIAKDVVDDIFVYIKDKDAKLATETTVKQFLEKNKGNGELTNDGLSELFLENLKRYGVSDETYNALKYVNLFGSIKRARGYEEYAAEGKYLESDYRTVMNKRFKEASDNINNNYKNYTGERGTSSYNPFGDITYSRGEYVKALYDTLTKTLDNDTKKQLMGSDEWKKATQMSNSDAGKTLALSKALFAFNEEIKDPEIAAKISTINDAFVKLAGTLDTDAARIVSHMSSFDLFGELSSDDMDFIKRYMPNDQNLYEKRDAIIKDYQEKDAFNKSLKEHEGDATFTEKYNTNKRQMELLDILAKKQYFNIEELLKKGSGGGRNKEYPDFFNWFSNAYNQYKTATEQGGVDRGLALFKNNQELRELYGSLFMPNSTDQKDFGFNIGNGNLKAILDANRIQGGLEDGVVDFKKAAMEVAESMIAYGKANEKERGKFIQTGEQLRKWVVETLSRDEVAKWLKELTKSSKDLVDQFNQTKSGVELYRQLIKNGTDGVVAPMAGIGGLSDTAFRPMSKTIKESIGTLISDFNSTLEKMKREDDKTPYTPFSIEGHGDLNSLEGIGKLRRYLTNEIGVNNNAFSATKEGQITKDTLVNLLNQLESALTSEFSSLSTTSMSGNKLTDAVANAIRQVQIDSFINDIAQQNAKDKGLGVDQEATKKLVDVSNGEAAKIMEQFMQKNNFSALMDGIFGTKNLNLDKLYAEIDKLIETIRSTAEKRREAAEMRFKGGEISRDEYEREISGASSLDLMANNVEMRKKDFSQKALAAESKTGSLRAFAQNWDQFIHAGDIAKKEYDDTVARGNEIGGGTFDAATNQFIIDPNATQEQVAGLQQVNGELDRLGVNGENYKQELKEAAGINLQAGLSAASKTLGTMKDAVMGVVQSFQALSDAVNYVYDAMNDGENPEWMLEMNDYLSAFGEAFEQIIAPVVAVIAVITALTVAVIVLEAVCTPLLIIMLAIIAAAAIVAAIVAAFKAHDKALERDIEGLKKQVDALSDAMTNLNAIAERSTGFDKLSTRLQSLGKNMEQSALYAEMARKEDQKKDSDNDKIAEYKQKEIEARDEFLNSLKDLRDELTKSSDDWADKMSQTIRSAFQNGTNAARDFRSAIKEMMGDIVEEMLKMYILQPAIDAALNELMGGSVEEIKKKFTNAKTGVFDYSKYLKEIQGRLGDDRALKKFEDQVTAAGMATIDAADNLSSYQKGLYAFNSEVANLSGGIQGMTEDTGRTLEGLGNSMLGVMINVQALLQNYFMAQSGYGNSPMTQIQTHLRVLESNVIEMRNFAESIENHLSKAALGTTALHVKID